MLESLASGSALARQFLMSAKARSRHGATRFTRVLSLPRARVPSGFFQ